MFYYFSGTASTTVMRETHNRIDTNMQLAMKKCYKIYFFHSSAYDLLEMNLIEG